MNRTARGSTERVQHLISSLTQRGLSDRRAEWFAKDELPDLAPAQDGPYDPLMIRRARAFAAMLQTMTDSEAVARTGTYTIEPGELIVGVMPMGSLGLGKVFPNYLTDREKQVAFFSARDIDSVLAHNVPDHGRVLRYGLRAIMEACDERLKYLEIDRRYPIGSPFGSQNKIEFYQAVKICCQAVVDYAARFADLALLQAVSEPDPTRRAELMDIAAICRKVPLEPAESFHEALQCIYTIHLALHASASHLSIGRLDQLLQPYYERSLAAGTIDRARAVELLECFWVKAASRLTLTPEFIVEQDHTEFATGMGHNPFLVDQEVTINQFMQNIVVGGVKRDGTDACNDCTFLVLEACSNAGLATPVLNARLHAGSSEAYLQAVARTLHDSGAGQPIIYNDEAVIPGLLASGKIPIEEARDYVVDGCWEALLNAKCDFNYNMVNLLTVLECTLNRGAGITGSRMQLRGPKMSFLSAPVEEIGSLQQLEDIFREHLRYFTNKAGLELFSTYALEGSVTPTPFFSALLGRCLEAGIDKTWGGADYQLGGVVFIAMTNAANALAALQEWVFEKGKYTLPQVLTALRANYEGHREMRADFLSSPKFGNNDPRVDTIMARLCDTVHAAVREAEKLCEYVYLDEPQGDDERRRVYWLRRMTGYEGSSMKRRYGQDFNITFSTGAGTFAQYAFFGTGCAASADGRFAGEPVAPNISPSSGTASNGVGGVLASYKGLGLDRFGAGAMVDLCFDKREASPELMREVLRRFTENKASIISVTIIGQDQVREIYEICKEVRAGNRPGSALLPYSDVSVRVGGWNGPFVALTEAQQLDYTKRAL